MDYTLKTIKEVFVKYKRVNISDANIMHKSVISEPKTIANITMELLKDLDEERFLSYYMNSANKIIAFSTVGIGGVNSCSVDVGRVFRPAIQQGANAIIVAHNHPSGSLDPSSEDKSLTKRLVRAGNLLDIKVLDHIIIANDMYISFAEKFREYLHE